MRYVLRALSPNAISAADRGHPDVLADLRASLRRTMGYSILGVLPTSVSVATLFWSRSSQLGLLLWALVVLAIAFSQWFVCLRPDPKDDWTKRASYFQSMAGVFWGGLPWIAMPNDPEWQVFVAALMVGILAANVLFASQFRLTFYSFMVPTMLLACSALFFQGEGAGQWSSALVLYAGLFSIGLSHISRNTDIAASVFAVRSSELSAGLEAERRLLREANDRLAVLARTDTLTGLPNRLDFNDRLEAAFMLTSSEIDGCIGVAYLDLDGFKEINDTYGHHAGDEVLVGAANRLTSVLREGELLARLGGDELTVLSTDIPGSGGAESLGERLLASFEAPFAVDGRRISIGCSIGVAEATKGTTPESLLRAADAALYESKDSGGRQVRIAQRTQERNGRRASDGFAKPDHAHPLPSLWRDHVGNSATHS